MDGGNTMNFLKQFLFGILIGGGAVLPGISSGVICVVLGVYDILIHSILNFFSNIKKNFIFLLPIALGGFIGVFLFGNILKQLFLYYPTPTHFSFIGLILGSIPILFKKANNGKKIKLFNILLLIISFSLTIVLLKIENSSFLFNTQASPEFWYLVLSGLLMSCGIVIPGVSSTAILMLLGIYNTYLLSISNLNMQILFPIGIGLLFGCIIFLKLIEFLLNKYFSQTYYSIIRLYAWILYFISS